MKKQTEKASMDLYIKPRFIWIFKTIVLYRILPCLEQSCFYRSIKIKKKKKKKNVNKSKQKKKKKKKKKCVRKQWYSSGLTPSFSDLLFM